MKLSLLYFAIATSFALGCAVQWETKRPHPASEERANQGGRSGDPDPGIVPAQHWQIRQAGPDEKLPWRIEFFIGQSECGFIERWSQEISPHFMILIYQNQGESPENSSGAADATLVDGYDTLEPAMCATERICANH